MKLPNQFKPILKPRDQSSLHRSLVLNDGCGWIDKAKCAAEFAGLIIGPCDPVGLPEDLPLCIPAFAGFVSSCGDCVTSTFKSTICAVVSEASNLGIPIPSVLKNLCN